MPKIEITDEITDEIRDKVRERFGNIVDNIKLKSIGSDKYEMEIRFQNLFQVNNTTYSDIINFMIENSMHQVCHHIEKLVLDCKLNIKESCMLSGINVYVSDNVPEGMVWIHPKTYDEIMVKGEL